MVAMWRSITPNRRTIFLSFHQLFRWKCTKNEKFDDYLGKHGIGYVTRKIVNKVPCTVEIVENEDRTWTVNEVTAVRTATSTYSLGVR